MTYQSTVLTPEEVQDEMRSFEAHHLGGNKHTSRVNSTDGHYVLPTVADAFSGWLSKAEYLKLQQENKFTLYWLGGNREVLIGATFEAAFTAAGYGKGAMSALDFYSGGDDTRYEYKAGNWVLIVPINLNDEA